MPNIPAGKQIFKCEVRGERSQRSTMSEQGSVQDPDRDLRYVEDKASQLADD